MRRHRSLKYFLVACLVICASVLFSSAITVTAAKFNIDLSLSIPYFLRVSYSSGSCSETITTQDRSVFKRISLEFTPRNDGLYESVIALEIRSNANWQMTITPLDVDDSAQWIVHEGENDIPSDTIEAGRPISELDATFQCNPETTPVWHLHVLSPSCPNPVRREMTAQKQNDVGATPTSAAATPAIQLTIIQQDF